MNSAGPALRAAHWHQPVGRWRACHVTDSGFMAPLRKGAEALGSCFLCSSFCWPVRVATGPASRSLPCLWTNCPPRWKRPSARQNLKPRIWRARLRPPCAPRITRKPTSGLQTLLGKPKLSREQTDVTARGMLTVHEALEAAQAKGRRGGRPDAPEPAARQIGGYPWGGLEGCCQSSPTRR